MPFTKGSPKCKLCLFSRHVYVLSIEDLHFYMAAGDYLDSLSLRTLKKLSKLESLHKNVEISVFLLYDL